MSDLYETLRAEFYALRGKLQDRLADGFQWTDLFPLLRDFCRSAVVIAEAMREASGATKKELVIEAAMAWWKDELRPFLEANVNIPGPDALAWGAIEYILPGTLEFIIDWIVSDYNVFGWPQAA